MLTNISLNYRKKTTFGGKIPSIAVEESLPPTPATGLSVISESNGSTRERLPSPPITTKAVTWEESPRTPPLQCSVTSLRRRSSASRPIPVAQTPPAPRRTSVPGRRTHPTFVHQDELWLTQRHRPRCLLNNASPPDGKYIAYYFIILN